MKNVLAWKGPKSRPCLEFRVERRSSKTLGKIYKSKMCDWFEVRLEEYSQVLFLDSKERYGGNFREFFLRSRSARRGKGSVLLYADCAESDARQRAEEKGEENFWSSVEVHTVDA